MMTLFNISIITYLAALILAVIALVVRRRLFTVGSISLLSAGSLSLVAYIIIRWMNAGRAPFSNMFESLVLLGWGITAVYLLFRFRINVPVLDAAVSLMALLVMAYAGMLDPSIHPLVPALQSNWLTVHVLSCMLAYGGFAVSFVSAICYLVSSRTGSSTSKDTLDRFEAVLEKTVSFGFFFLTVGIITGSVWANVAWGTYWSWDPKETWSLVTWFVYAIYLHCRFVRGWRGRVGARIAVMGFICVIITYLGVNFIMKGLHSYA